MILMPPSNLARTATITDEQILEAARSAFLEHGMQATTSAIAKRARVSEGTLFRRFETKEGLFLAAMGLDEPEFFETLDGLVGVGELDENLIRLGHEMLDFFAELLPRVTMMMSCGMLGHLSDDADEIPPVRGLKRVSAFFEREMKIGRVRTADPEVVARMWVSMMHHYAFQEYMGLNQFMPMSRGDYLHGVVELILKGLETGDGR